MLSGSVGKCVSILVTLYLHPSAWHVHAQRRYDMRHEMLTQRAPFCIGARDGKKGHAESAFRDACRTFSGSCILKEH